MWRWTSDGLNTCILHTVRDLSENLHCNIDGVTLVVFVNVFPSIYLQTSSDIRNSAECAIICGFVKRRRPLLYEQEVEFALDFVLFVLRPPLWSSGQSFWLQIQRSRVRSPALPDFLISSGSGTGYTQPREVKLRSYLNEKVAAPGSENRD